MSTPATGELRRLKDGFEAYIRISKARRRGFNLTSVAGTDETAARERCKAMAQFASRLRVAGHEDKVEELLRMAARAKPGKGWDAIVAAVDTLVGGRAVPIGAPVETVTWAKLGEEWSSGRLAAKHPDHVRRKKHVDADERIAATYVNPKIGDLDVRTARLEHFEIVMAALPDHLKPASRRHVAQYMSKLAGLAVYPCRLLTASPIPRGWLPKGTGRLAMQCLRPAEDAALLACAAVPLVERLFYGIADREGMRKEELAPLVWGDLDLEHGAITLDHNKTDDPRSWALHPGVVRALTVWKERYRKDAPADERVFIDENGVPLSTHHMAERLRRQLKIAGVTRAELFARSDARIPLRVHDLRSTAVTVWLANGKSEAWCCDRTGHRSSTMLNRYRRAARSWSELGLGELQSLDEAIPELRPVVSPDEPVPYGVPQKSRRPLGGTVYAGDLKAIPLPTDARHVGKIDSEPTSSEGEVTSVEAPLRHSEGQSDAVESALAKALEGATAAGQWSVVAQLAKELEARRLARSSNVRVGKFGRSSG